MIVELMKKHADALDAAMYAKNTNAPEAEELWAEYEKVNEELCALRDRMHKEGKTKSPAERRKERQTMTENLIYAMRKEGLNFYTCDNEVWVVNDDGFELTATCNAENIAMHGVAGSKIHAGMTSISGFVAAARDWLA